MNITDSNFRYTGSLSTNIRERFRAEGFAGPQKNAEEQEQQVRYEGALRCMRRIEADAALSNVTHLDFRRRKP